MHDRLLTAFDRLKSPVNQFFPALGKYLYHHIVRYHSAVYKLAQKIKLNLTRRRKTDLNFFKSEFDQIIKKLDLFLHDHRIDQGLIPVTQGHAAPYGRLCNLFVRPFSFRIVDNRIFLISLIIQHDLSSVFHFKKNSMLWVTAISCKVKKAR